MSAPAACASFCLSPRTTTATFFDLPRPCGRPTVPRTCWSACFGSTPKRTCSSTDSSNLAVAHFLTMAAASSSVFSLARSRSLISASNLLPMLLSPDLLAPLVELGLTSFLLDDFLLRNLDAHRARRAHNHLG